MPQVILLSQFSLPYNKIGSWTTLYGNYLRKGNLVNYIVCEKPFKLFVDVEYSFLRDSFRSKLSRKISGNKYINYQESLNSVLKPKEKYIIQIVDNFGIVPYLIKFLEDQNLRQNCYVQFFYHGYAPYFENFAGREFLEQIDEMVLLTIDSYRKHKDYYTILTPHFSILHNGIDTSKFSIISSSQKAEIRQELDLSDKKVFLWCSQDRPKKGLHLVLDAWKAIVKQHKNVVLIIIGCEPKIDSDTIKYLGRIPNEELPKYYQMADCYLFPTLWHEGFGMSLIEALHCGCYCIASALGGVPEVLQYGKYGKLIESPHFVSEWVKAIEEFLNSDFRYPELPKDLYSTETWNHEMNQIIQTAKERLAQR